MIKETFAEFKRRLYTSQIDFDQLANWYWQEHQGVSETVVHRSQYEQMCEGFENTIRSLEAKVPDAEFEDVLMRNQGLAIENAALKRDLERSEERITEILDEVNYAKHHTNDSSRCFEILRGILGED